MTVTTKPQFYQPRNPDNSNSSNNNKNLRFCTSSADAYSSHLASDIFRSTPRTYVEGISSTASASCTTQRNGSLLFLYSPRMYINAWSCEVKGFYAPNVGLQQDASMYDLHHQCPSNPITTSEQMLESFMQGRWLWYGNNARSQSIRASGGS